MADQPLLVFPGPATGEREKRKGFGAGFRRPDHKRQGERLSARFEELEKSFSSQKANVAQGLSGAAPEQVIVFETVGSIENFARAVQKIEGMEWLAEQVEDFLSDEDFFDEKEPEKKLSGRLFLVMASQKALNDLLSFWRFYLDGEADSIPHGQRKWRLLFEQLKAVRTWQAADRLHPDVLEDWRYRVERNEEYVVAEVELWFRRRTSARDAAAQRLRQLVEEEQGRIIASSQVEAIAYHALLIELPIGAVQHLLGHPDTRLVQSGDVMFFRPASQVAVVMPAELDEDPAPPVVDSSPIGEPVVALLDGMPLEQHEVLSGRLRVDDPDGWADRYPANYRVHGTAMASLIIAGDLHTSGTRMSRPLYVRPVLLPNPSAPAGKVDERMPADALPVDLIHRAVRRIFEGEGKEPAAAPTVRIINFSVGDASRLFDNQVSPLARLLDWLAVKYGVLFVVSAGNHINRHPDYLTLRMASADFASATDAEVEISTIRALVDSAHERRLLSPAEAVNVLTVASAQRDGAPANTIPTIRELVSTPGCPCALNALGLGFGRSVKPDVLAPGGRAHYMPAVVPADSPRFSIVDSARAPGLRVASPGSGGSTRGVVNSCGTSNAAALATRAAARLLDVIESLRLDDGSRAVPDGHSALAVRALLAHSASWGPAGEAVRAALAGQYPAHALRQHITRLLGYGEIAPDWAASCSDQRATAITTGEIGRDEGHTYTLPLPEDLAGKKVWRRLAITLAWQTPTNPETRAYRQALLSIDPPGSELRVVRQHVDDKAVRRGTIQHEVLEGTEASAYSLGSSLRLVVNCRTDDALKDRVPYALIATLEVAAGEPIRVYEQIRDRLRPALAVRATARA